MLFFTLQLTSSMGLKWNTKIKIRMIMKILNRYKLIIMCLVLASGWSNTVSAQIIFSEIMYDPCSLANGQGADGDCEYIEFFNSYSTPIDLCGATFTGAPAAITFTFPCPSIIPSGAYFVIHRSPGTCNNGATGYDLTALPNVIGIYTGTLGNGTANSPVETVTLSTCGGAELASVTYPDITSAASCMSVTYDDLGTPTAASPTPGTGTLAVGTTPAPTVYISELSYNPAGCTGTDGVCEYFVVTNSGTVALDLTGYGIQTAFTYSFPAGTMIPAGGSLSVGRNNCPNFTFDLMGGWGTTNMNNTSETLELTDGTTVINSVTYNNSSANGNGDAQSYDACGDFAEPVSPSPAMCSISNVMAAVAICNGDNAEIDVSWTEAMTSGTVEVDINGEGFVQMASGETYIITGPTTAATAVTVTVRDNCNKLCMATTMVDIPECLVPCTAVDTEGNVFITEIMYLPCGVDQNTGEFVEICNKSTTVAYDIGDFIFQDRFGPGLVNILDRFVVPVGTMLLPGECYASPPGVFASNLTNTGETLSITDNCGTVIDVVTYEPSPCGGSYSLSLVDWENQDTTTNNNMANYAPGADVGESVIGPVGEWMASAGGSPGEPNTYGACINVPSDITATCNADFTITFDIPYTDANNAPFSSLILEVYDGTTLFATSAPNSMISDNATFTIPGQAMQNGLVLTIQPQEGTIEQGCVDTQFTLNIPECVPPDCNPSNGTFMTSGN